MRSPACLAVTFAASSCCRHLVSHVVSRSAGLGTTATVDAHRYISKRHASVHAALQPAFLRWRSWARAATHHRCFQQQAALEAWRELLQLQMQLCVKVNLLTQYRSCRTVLTNCS